MILPDVGVWLAAVWEGHAHHRTVSRWFERQEGDLILCRVTQMSLLRLITNPAVMGDDIVSRSVAWTVVDRVRADQRMRLLDEPLHIEGVWRVLSAHQDQSHKLWTDDYLAAFAQTGQLALATIDRGFAKRYRSIVVHTLLPDPEVDPASK